jgi:hypothetical protein
MSVLQHYYTSFVNPETGSAGFQVKGRSPRISPEVEAIITRLIAYRIPPTMDERAIQQHPVALRYYYKDQHECILLCSQSNGSDENGRPGNFFAHTLVLEPEIFTTTPPIFYWGSSFWVKKDTGGRPQMNVLPELRSFEEESSLDIERVWNFLASAKRKTQFRKLMSAVVHSNKTLRRIVIIDTAEHVALWIAAVSCMLPPDYRPLLSFATYHHDPYQGQFMITGTTSDSSFRNSTEEYITYFVLNTETDAISEVKASLYADLIADCTRPDLYEARILPLFALAMRRFPRPDSINEQLDLLARYATLIGEQSERVLTPDELSAIDLVLTGFEELPTYEEDDVADLKRLGPILENALLRLQSSDEKTLRDEVSKSYMRIFKLLEKHQVTTAESVLRALQEFTKRLISGEANIVSSIQTLQQAHTNQAFQETFERTEYLQFLNNCARRADANGLQLAWQYLGRYLKPDPHIEGFLLNSLQVLSDLWDNKQNSQASALFDAMKQAMQGREEAWLALAVNGDIGSVDRALKRFYCKLVHPLDLNARLPYRTIMQRAYERIIVIEIEYDVAMAGVQDMLATVVRWVRYARVQKIEPISLVIERGLKSLQKHCPSEQWPSLAPSILESKDLIPLPSEWENNLVEAATMGLSLSRFSPTDIEFYRKYQNRDGLSDQKKTVMAGIVAMSTGQLDVTLADRLHQYFKAMTAMDAYYAEVNAFIREFFKTRFTADAHRLMLNALFRWNFHESFWQAYDAATTKLLTQSSSAGRIIDLLSCWFALSPQELRPPYVLQAFFVRLPRFLEETRKKGDRGFAILVRDFNARGIICSWYQAMQPCFAERRGVLAAIGQNIGQLPRLFAGQQGDKEIQIQEAKEREGRLRLFDLEVGKLFEGSIREAHQQNVAKLYTTEGREPFWSSYWDHFEAQLVSRRAQPVLDILSFWFDEAFETLNETPYAAQEFFLGCSETFDVVRKVKEFRETARELQATWTVPQNRERYPWYPIVKHFFSV